MGIDNTYRKLCGLSRSGRQTTCHLVFKYEASSDFVRRRKLQGKKDMLSELPTRKCIHVTFMAKRVLNLASGASLTCFLNSSARLCVSERPLLSMFSNVYRQKYAQHNLEFAIRPSMIDRFGSLPLSTPSCSRATSLRHAYTPPAQLCLSIFRYLENLLPAAHAIRPNEKRNAR